MKFALAFLAVVAADDTTKVWDLTSVQDHRSDAALQKDYGDHSVNSANARPPLRSHLMTIAEAMESIHKKHKMTHKARHHENRAIQLADDEVDHSGEFFKSSEHDKLGDGGYQRVITPRFAADDDDIFMRSMIQQYALEGKNKDGSPNGQFWMDEANTYAAASEVL